MSINLQAGKATSTGVTFVLGGLVHLAFDLVSQARSGRDKDGAFKVTCPRDHGVPVRARQVYVCEDDPGHGRFYLADLGRAKELDDGSLVAADPEEIVAAKVGALEPGRIELSVHRTDEVMAVCRPGEAGYLLRPSKGKAKKLSEADAKTYATLRALVESRPDLVLVGSLRLRDKRKVYRITSWSGQLLLEELVMPSDLKDPDEIDVPVDETVASKMEALLEMSVEDFDEGQHRWDVAEAVKALVAAKAADPEAAPVAAPAFSSDDIDALLTAALEAKAAAEADQKVDA